MCETTGCKHQKTKESSHVDLAAARFFFWWLCNGRSTGVGVGNWWVRQGLTGTSPRDCAIMTAIRSHRKPHRPQLELFLALSVPRVQGASYPRHWRRSPLTPVRWLLTLPTACLSLLVSRLPPLILWGTWVLVLLLRWELLIWGWGMHLIPLWGGRTVVHRSPA